MNRPEDFAASTGAAPQLRKCAVRGCDNPVFFESRCGRCREEIEALEGIAALEPPPKQRPGTLARMWQGAVRRIWIVNLIIVLFGVIWMGLEISAAIVGWLQ